MKSASAEGKNGNTDFTPAAYRVTSQLPFRGSDTDLAYEISPMYRESLEALGLPVTDMFGDVTDTDDDTTDTFGDVTDAEARGVPVTDTDYANVTDRETPDEAVEAPGQRQTRRPRSEMRQRILTLLGEHPEGLSAEQIRAYLQPDKPLGDTLQGMRRQGRVYTRGTGKALRYFVA